MADQNPFSSYAPEDQNYIADQLRTAVGTGKLNPAQLQGVQSALKYLPISKEAAADQVDKTIGYGSMRLTPQQKFADTMYVDPQSKLFGGAVSSPDQKYTAPHDQLVDVRNVPAARRQMQSQLGMNAKVLAGDEAGDSTGSMLMEGLSHLPEAGGTLGRTLGQAAVPNWGQPTDRVKTARAVTGAIGEFAGSQITDPNNIALIGTMGAGIPKALQVGAGAAFTAQMGYGAVEGAGQLGEVWDRADVPRDRKIELGTNIVLNTLMAGITGGHTVKSFLNTVPESVIPVADKAEIQQRIESEWQQLPNGQMIRRQATPATTVIDGLNVGPLPNRFKPIVVDPKPSTPATDATVSQTGVLSADELSRRQNAGEQFAVTSDTSQASHLEQMMMMGGRLDHAVLDPKPVSGASPDRVSTSEASKADTDYYAQAKAEWMEKNPGVSPDRGISEIARRSNELKTGVSDPTLKPSASKTPVQETVPQELSPREKAKLLKPDRSGVTDLRTADADTRHEWVNMKAGFEIKSAENAGEAFRQARQLFGPERHIIINSFLDKDGSLRHGIETPVDETGKPIMHPSPANAEDVSRLTLSGQKLFEAVQDGEGKFNDLTGGKHSQVLEKLWNATKETLPDSLHEARLSLYNKGLSTLLDAARDAKSINDFQKAFDVVTKKSEGGFASPLGKQRISDADAKLLAKLHADTIVSRWERLSDAALKGHKVEKKLTDPSLRNSVYGAGDPVLEGRYEALLDRSSKLRASDPIASLGHTLDGHSITERDVSAGALREGLGTAARDKEMRQKALQTYRDEWNSRPITDTIKFIDAVENGDLQSITDPKDRSMAGNLRDLLDTKREQIRDLGRDIMRTRISEYDEQIANAKSPEQAKMWRYERNYIENHLNKGETSLLNKFNENYFPHVWRYGLKDVAANLMQGRRPFGPQGFLKQRTYSTFTEGIADGMEPVTYNPVDMTLLKLHELDRFITAHTTFNTLKDMGLAHIFSPDRVPDGWTKVNDNIFNAGSEAAWYMPRDAATPLNRHLSPGLRGNVLYDAVAHYNNAINAFNLGLSAFHGVETGVNATASRMGLGLVKLSRLADFPKNLSGLADIGKSLGASVQAAWIGRKVAAEYLEPGKYSQYSATADAIAQGGGRIHMPTEYSNQATEAFRNAWKEVGYSLDKGMPGRALSKAALGTYRSLGALMEQVGKPIMEWYVPSTKLGIFHWMAEDILNRMPSNASPELMRKEFGYAWDRVDDRFGQVVYDNLFWNRMAKDVAHLAIRSVGWNYGDVRELGGAVWDLRDKASLKAAATGKGITQKQGYVLGLLGVTAMMGYTMLAAFQGTAAPKINSPLDLLYPPNGKLNPDGSQQRVYLKTYIHDAYQFSHAPGETGFNKTAPIWHQIGDMYRNADYYGTQIHPIHATIGDALTDPNTYTGVGKYLLDQSAPFSVRNFEQRRAQGESISSSLTSTAAILPAPKWVGQSKAELLAFELFKTKLKQGPNDSVKDASVQKYHELASGYAANRYTAKDVTDAFKQGIITAKQLDGILDEDEGKLSPLERHVKQLEPHELLRVWEAASPDEKKVLTAKYLHAWDTIDDKYSSSAEQSLQLHKRFLSNWQTFMKSKQSN